MMWIFGYGSLIYRPGFSFLEKRLATLVGFERRFWQASPDHRGTASTPGRVLTLVRKPQAQCVGMAWRIADDMKPQILRKLDERESAGYQRRVGRARLKGELDYCDVVFYYADHRNKQFLGDAKPIAMAKQINICVGPSGSNYDYLAKLMSTFDQFGIDDAHCADLWQLTQSERDR